MIEVRPFELYHLELIRAQGVQSAQVRDISHVPLTSATLTKPQGPAVSAFAADRLILCGGIVRQFEGHGQCWAVLSQDASRHMLWLHYATRRFISLERWQRLEASVEKGFTAGCRWAELLGFKFEGEMPNYGMDGQTHLRYGRYA
jgi:hypothetical protein